MSLPAVSHEPFPAESGVDTAELADILLFLQRCFLTNLSLELSRGSVSFPGFFLLAALDRGEPLTMTQIAARMRHSTAAATGLVDRLAATGYAARAHATDDRRKVLVQITPRGSTLVAHIKDDMVRSLNATMTHLTPAEQRAWLQVYRRVYQVVQAQLYSK